MYYYFLIFIYSALIDGGAVLYTRAVQRRNIWLGVFSTGSLAALNWAAIWTVMKQDDPDLMVVSIFGHVVGFVAGMFVPLRDESRTGRPTTEPGSRSSDPS